MVDDKSSRSNGFVSISSQIEPGNDFVVVPALVNDDPVVVFIPFDFPNTFHS